LLPSVNVTAVFSDCFLALSPYLAAKLALLGLVGAVMLEFLWRCLMMRFLTLCLMLFAANFAAASTNAATDSTSKIAAPNESIAAETLLRDSKCAGCHAAKFATAADKTGDAIYTRSNRSVTSYAKLVTQVARCDTELNLQVFEDDQAIISRYLNARFYKFVIPSNTLKTP
jgi:hypothetical protein